jgi:two-component system phosphate regulon response regulator PhoB
LAAERAAAPLEPLAGRADESRVGATILICEDDQAVRSLLSDTLGEGYMVIEAEDGWESVEIARRVRPDLVVLDMVLPGCSGLDVLAAVRRDPRLARMRVVMCTASTRAFDGVRAEEFGADRYLQKPFSPAELLAVVEELVPGAQ